MKVSDIQNVAVIGAGLMGHGIAQEFAQAGYQVRLTDVSDTVLERARKTIQGNLDMMTGFGLIDAEQAAAVLPAIQMSTSLTETVADADLVVEAVFENRELKEGIFRDLDRLCRPHTILASNTSTFLPSKLAQVTSRPDKVLIAHYFNPPFLLPLVEVVRHAETSDETVSIIYDLLTKIGKKPVIIQKEVPGFIANRLQAAVLREALWLLQQGIVTAEDVDTVITSSIGRRWSVAGVFEVFDIAGWDLILNVAEPEPHDFGSSPEEAVALIREKIENGDLGVKTGKGFYDWDDESTAALRERIAAALVQIAGWEK